MLHNTRAFADVINVMDFKIRRLTWIFRWVQYNDISHYIALVREMWQKGKSKIWSMRIVGLKMKKAICQGNRDLTPITTSNWILPTTWKSLEVESSPEPSSRNPAQLAHWFWACNALAIWAEDLAELHCV